MRNDMTRRRFIRQTGCACAGAGILSGLIPLSAQTGESSTLPDVAAVQGDPKPAVARAFELLGGIEKFIRPGATVLLKPNMSFPNADRFGSTTSPDMVRAVADLSLEAGASRVIVADHTMQDSALCFEKTGIKAALAVMDRVTITALDRESLYTEVPVPGGRALPAVKIAKLAAKCDVFINMPCAKSHAATQVSFGLKNLMGLVWDRTFFHTGTDLHTAIAELATVIRPHLTLLDATRALVTGGPTGPGKVQELNTVIAGTNMLAVDVYAATIAPWFNRSVTARSIKHLSVAAGLGLGEIDENKLSVVRESV